MMLRRTRPFRASLACVALAMGAASFGGTLQAGDRRLDGSGTLHWVTVETYQHPFVSFESDALVHHAQASDGALSQNWIPGTDDPYDDRSPRLVIDPVTDRPIVVWVRDEGAGADLYLTRLAGDAWSAPRRLLSTTADESAPGVSVTRDRIHVHWYQDDGSGTEFHRAIFARRNAMLAHGPERIHVEDAPLVSDKGGGPGAPSAPSDLTYEGGIEPGESGRIFIWGIRDEPVPVGYVLGFMPAEDATAPSDLSARELGGRMVLSYRSGSSLFYTIEEDTGWTETRRLELGGEFDAAEARREIERSLMRREFVQGSE